MNKNSRIYVAGHNGLVGSAIINKLKEQGYTNIITKSRSELDLTDESAVKAFFQNTNPEYVFLAAAKVGGINANNSFPVDFIVDNIKIQTNIITNCINVKKLLFLGSSCIYPKNAPQPIKEEYLLTGPLEETNSPYAIAKIAGIEMCKSYIRQYNKNFICAMPTNMYGPRDNYDLQSSHVLPAMIRKFHEAKVSNRPYVELWGDGSARREFLHSFDFADACIMLMQKYNATQSDFLINVGCGNDHTISELAKMIKSIVGFTGTIHWNTSMPNGTARKMLDVSKLTAQGWIPSINILDGIKMTYKEYVSSL